jgi:hypothetical protein
MDRERVVDLADWRERITTAALPLLPEDDAAFVLSEAALPRTVVVASTGLSALTGTGPGGKTGAWWSMRSGHLRKQFKIRIPIFSRK